MTLRLVTNQHRVPKPKSKRNLKRATAFHDWCRHLVDATGMATVNECWGISGADVVHKAIGSKGHTDNGAVLGADVTLVDASWHEVLAADKAHPKDGDRVALRLVTEVGGGQYVDWVVHGSLIGHRWDEQFAELLPLVKADVDAGEHVIVSGDLNTAIVGHRRAAAWFGHAGLTEGAYATTSMWLMCSPNLAVTHQRTFAKGAAPGSDHAALLVDVTPVGTPTPTPAPEKHMPNLVIDYAWSHPNPVAIKAAGYVGVMRYLSNDPSKNLTRTEAAALHAQGLGIGVVWEATANRAGQGYGAGVADAKAADAQADALGYPLGCPIFFAVDYDAAPSAVKAYFDGAKATCKRAVGCYGGINVESAVGVKYRWQTVAWSGGKVDGGAHLYQRISPTRRLSGSFDENVVLNAFPMWGNTAPKPAPAPAPTPNHVQAGRALVTSGLTQFDAAPKSRLVVHGQAAVIRKALDAMPKK